jgi:hypothetical protein
MQALTLINLCAREYNDILFARIAKSPSGNVANWLDYLNDAQRAVALARPDSNSVTETIQLIPGSRQTIPATAVRLMDVSRNRGSDGLFSGDTIRMAERDVQDMVSRSWHRTPTGTIIRELFYNDKKDPRTYWVRPAVPPAPSTVWIEITTSKLPADLTDADTDAIALPDTYGTPMQQWMLYRAYSLATQAVNQYQRATSYFSAFFNILGVKLRNDMWLSPNAPDILPKVEAERGDR